MNLLSKFLNLSPHLRTAVILAPLLGIAGYIAAGYYAANKQPAQTPEPPALALRGTGTCALMVGDCSYRRDDLVVNFSAKPTGQGDTLIQLEPNSPIQGAVMGIHSHGNETPRNMRKIKGENNWTLIFSGKLETPVKIRTIVIRDGVSYFAELMAN